MPDDQTKAPKPEADGERKLEPLDRRGFLKAGGALMLAVGVMTACDTPTPREPTPVPPQPLPPSAPDSIVPGPYEEVPATPAQAPDPNVLEFFTMHEARTVEALAATILPGTPEDPGAREGGVLNYIDHLLAHRHGFAQPIYRLPPFAEPYFGEQPPADVEGPQPIWVKADQLPRYGYQSSLTPREIYRQGVQQVDAFSRERFGAPFADLAEADQESVVEVMADSPGEIFGPVAPGQPQDQSGGGEDETGFRQPSLREFFEVVRNHVIEGMFADPLYGGNRDLVGWYLLGYPGAQRAYTPVEFQTEGTDKEPQSIADLPHFHPGQPANEYVILPVTGSDSRKQRR